MKRFYFLLFLCSMIMPQAIHAQLKKKTPLVQFGIIGGMNISMFHVADNEYDSYVDKKRPGFTLGPTAIITLPIAGLKADVSALYDLRAAKSEDNSDSKTISCSSFQFPVNLRYSMNFGDMVEGFVFTGPQFGVNVGSKEQLIALGIGSSTGHAMERRWVANGSTFSWNIGVGGVIDEKVQVRLSYNMALKNTGEIHQVDLVNGNSKVLTTGKAHAVQITLSYLF